MRRDIEINTNDGVAKAAFFSPDETGVEDRPLHGVIFYMDGLGPRDALYGMAQRLADAGYAVLLPDLFYRAGVYGPFTIASFADEKGRAEIMALIRETTHARTKQDTAAFLEVFDAENITGPIGAVGYCFGGGRAMTAAAAYPDRIAAAASFHGGNLASEAADSPHRCAADIKGRVYVGVAGVDNSFPPEQSTRLAEALRIGGVDHVIENYVGMGHGWTVPDHGTVYDEKGAERHWKRLLTFFEETLV